MTKENQDDGGTVGDEKTPVDVYNTVDGFLDMFRAPPVSPTLYAGTIELETDDGTLVITGEDRVRVEWEPSDE